MSSPGLRATVAVVALAFLGVTSGALGVFELSQPTATTTTTSTSYVASLSPFLNVSIRPNPLYLSTNLTNPRSIFSNITTGLSLSFGYQFEASQPLAVAGVLSCDVTFLSGTSSPWSITVYSRSHAFSFNASADSYWMPTPVNLSLIASTLNESLAIDREFDLSFAGGTLVVNASMEMDLPGGIVAGNATSLDLAFNYGSSSSGTLVPSAYSSINVAYSSPGAVSGELTTIDTDPLPSHTLSEELFLAVAAAAFVAAGLVGALYLPRQRPSTLQRFLSENGETVVRVDADPRMGRKAVRVKDLAELVKLANLSGQPIFLFDSPKGAFLYVIQGETTFACDVPAETAQERTAS